jgi:bifunctional DNase/RNase
VSGIARVASATAEASPAQEYRLRLKQGTLKERPLAHDLLANILRALGAKIERVIVNDLKRTTYFARLVLSAENESQQKKIIEIDARPSDCIAMATQQRAPIYVSLEYALDRLQS